VANNWDEFFASPTKASKRLHVTAADVARGAKIDARNAQRKAAAEALLAEQSRTAPTGLPYGITPKSVDPMSESPSMLPWDGNPGQTLAQWAEKALPSPTWNKQAQEGIGTEVILNTLPYGKIASALGKTAMPLAATAGVAYAGDATAGSRYDPSAFLKYIRQHFPDMFDSAKQGMKFTADTGREAGVYGLLGDSMSVKPRMIVHGSTNSVALPRDVRRELIDSANAFDMHTHPSGNALPSTPLNNAAQNALGGDTEYYQRTSRGTPWLRPGKADNLIVSVQPRAVREPLDFGNGRGESWTHMKMNEYPSKQELNSLDEYLVNNADRYENMLPMGDIGMMIPDDLNTFALLKHYADTGRGDFTYNLGKEVFGPGGREPATPMYEAIYNQLRKDKQLRNYADGGLVKSGLKMLFPNLSAPLHVVKPKGGNWLSGSVEDALKGLRSDVVRYDHPRFKELLPEDQSRLNADGVFGAMHDFTPEIKARISEKVAPINNWIEGPLTKYVKTRMASPEDEVRRLADQGVLHVAPETLGNSIRQIPAVVKERVGAGFPPEGLSRLQQGHFTGGYDWENASDSFITSGKAGSYANTNTFGGKNPGPTYLRDNPWLATVPPETPVYGFATRSTGSPQLAPSLGFDHLVDELSNALDPNSGLPRHLALTPEAVKNLSMEKAVRRVADINAWRAAQIAEANGKIAGGPGQELVREYPHSAEKPNPKGLRWVELNAKTPLPTGHEIKTDMTGTRVYGPRGEDLSRSSHPSAEDALVTFNRDSLEKQLKYEGDTMGHCVGGYCDDVASGHSRIFSLRDAKGEPHVTVETHPVKGKLEEEFERITGKIPINQREIDEFVARQYGDYTKAPPSGLMISQIKGKQNRKPNDEYLPFVQDFVKNPPHGQPWAEVGDLQNSGLKKVQMSEFGINGYMTKEELEAALKAAGVPEANISGHVYGQGFASGGSVGVPAAGWELLTDPTGSPEENKLSWDIFSGHNDPEQLEAVQ